jgi:hypothetical protein
LIITYISYTLAWGAQCDALDPRQQVSKSTVGKIEGSAKTLYKIATAGGSIERKLEEETRKLQEGVQDSEKARVKERLMYLFCLTVTASTELKAERKVELLNELQTTMLAESAPSPQSAPKGRPVYLKNCYTRTSSDFIPVFIWFKWLAEDEKWKSYGWEIDVDNKRLLQMTYGGGKPVLSTLRSVFLTTILSTEESVKDGIISLISKNPTDPVNQHQLEESSEGDYILAIGDCSS